MTGEKNKKDSSGLCSAVILFAVAVAMLVIGVQVNYDIFM